MEKDRTWNLFALKLSGKASPEEWAELQLLMEDKPEIALHLQALTNFWHQHSKYDRERIEKAIKKIAENYSGENEAQVLPVTITGQNIKTAINQQKRYKYKFVFFVKNCLAVIRNKINRYIIHRKTDSLTG
jgi:hypothetical protein